MWPFRKKEKKVHINKHGVLVEYNTYKPEVYSEDWVWYAQQVKWIDIVYGQREIAVLVPRLKLTGKWKVTTSYNGRVELYLEASISRDGETSTKWIHEYEIRILPEDKEVINNCMVCKEYP